MLWSRYQEMHSQLLAGNGDGEEETPDPYRCAPQCGSVYRGASTTGLQGMEGMSLGGELVLVSPCLTVTPPITGGQEHTHIVVLWECETIGTLIVDERVAVYPLLVNNIVKLIDKLPSP